MPPSLEERVACLEGKVEEHFRGFGEIRELLVHLNGRGDDLDQKVDRFRTELGGRIEALDQRVARGFNWLVGVQVAILLSIIGALLGRWPFGFVCPSTLPATWINIIGNRIEGPTDRAPAPSSPGSR